MIMKEPYVILPNAFYETFMLQVGLGISEQVLAKAKRSGELRFTRKGNQVLHLGQWVLDWLEGGSKELEGEQL